MQHVCLPTVHFNTLPIPSGSTIWMSAIFSAANIVGTVRFTDVTVYLNPAPGATGESLTATGSDSRVTISPGQALCDAASFEASQNLLSMATGSANSGKSLLSAVNIVAPHNQDLAGYFATM
jgi:hypothetical protein